MEYERCIREWEMDYIFRLDGFRGHEDTAGYGVIYDDMLSDTNAQVIREGVT